MNKKIWVVQVEVSAESVWTQEIDSIWSSKEKAEEYCKDKFDSVQSNCRFYNKTEYDIEEWDLN